MLCEGACPCLSWLPHISEALLVPVCEEALRPGPVPPTEQPPHPLLLDASCRPAPRRLCGDIAIPSRGSPPSSLPTSELAPLCQRLGFHFPTNFLF